MQYDFLVLLPPLVVVILAAITKNVRVSIGVAIMLAGLIVNSFSIPAAVQTVATRFWAASQLGNLGSFAAFSKSSNLFICLFLLALGIIIELIQQSGGAYAYGNFIINKLKSAKNVQRASLLLSLIFAIDDYFSTLTVGAVMRPISDQFRIARVKLALLVNVLASPLVVLFPLSSWIADIVGQLRQLGVAAVASDHTLIAQDPFYLYLTGIPFLFYSLIAIAAIWFMVDRGLSFGLLAKHETIAEKTGNLFAGKVSVARQVRKGANNMNAASIWDFLLPILLLIFSVVGVIWHAGDCSNISAALLIGGIITIIFSVVYLSIRKRISLREVPSLVMRGILLMAPSVFIIVLIWTFSALVRMDLHTGDYLAGLVGGRLPIVLLPVIFFLIAVFMSSTIGSAFGTFGALLPIALPMVVSLSGVSTPASPLAIPFLLPVLGAIISGGVAGNHLSPIADVSFMSAASAGCYHLDLVKVMISFAIPVVIATACSFLGAGLLIAAGFGTWPTVLISLAIGFCVCFLIMSVLHWVSHRARK